MVENYGIDVVQYRDNDGNFLYGTNSRRAIKEQFYICAEKPNGDGEQYIRKAEQIAIKNEGDEDLDYHLATQAELETLLSSGDGYTFWVALGWDELDEHDLYQGQTTLIDKSGRVHTDDAGKDVNDHNGIEITNLALAPCNWIRKVLYIY